MEPPEALRPQTDVEASPSEGGAPAKTASVVRALPAVPAVPDYDLLRRIGSGAYGDVWLARSVATGALRAAKIVWRNRFEDERPFRREFEGIQRFEQISREHPSQLALFHIGRKDVEGYFYYVMELADPLENPKSEIPGGLPSNPKEIRSPRSEPSVGDVTITASKFGLPSALGIRDSDLYIPCTLRAELEKGRLPAARVLEIGLALTEALAHLHNYGLVHRDVKPSNVIFVQGRPKLADIGLVTDASDQCSIVGTEGYLPPEGPGTPQADIFALGKVLYEAATGMDRREFPKLPEGLRSWSDAKQVFELNEIVLKACASEPRARYASVEPMLVELQMLLGGKSVKRRRTAQWWWAAAWRAGIGFAALGAIAAIVAVPMRGHPLPESYSDGPDSTNNVANVLCRKAIHVIRDDIYDEFSEAYSNLLKAARLDPRFARPYIGMLELRLRETFPGVPPAKTSEMQEIASKLNELLPNSAPAYCAQSVIQFYDWRFLQAEQCAQKAINANRNYELAHTFYAFMLTQWGTNRLDEARKQLALSETNLSGKATIPRCLGHIAYVERNFTNAISWYSNALALEPHHAPAILHTGRAYQALRDYTNAVAWFRQFRELLTTNKLAVADRYDSLLQAFREDGERGYWLWYWQQTEKRTNSDFYFKALVRIHLGDTDGALEWLNRSYTNREHADDFQTPLTYLLFDEHWDGLHDDPRFKALLDKIGFTKVMGPKRK